MLNDSIDNGPYQFNSEITVKDTYGITDIRRPQRLEDLDGQDKLRYDNDIKAVNILLLGLPVDIYTLINHYQTAKEIWDHCTVRKRVKDSEWFKEKMLLAQAQEAGVVLNDDQQDFLADSLEETDDCEDLQLQATANFKADHFDAYDSDCDDEATTNAIFMANLSLVGSLKDDTVEPRYDSDIHFEQCYMLTIGNDEDNYVPPPIQKNDMMLSIIEQMKSQVEKCNMVNQESKSVNESLTSELERYKDRVRVLEYAVKDGHYEQEAYLSRELYTAISDRNRKVSEYEKQVFSQKTEMKNLNNHIAFLKKNFKTLKQESSKRYEKNISEIVDLEKAKKELENIVFKVGQSAQTMHMLTKPQNFYDETHKTTLGYQNPLYLSQARQKQPALYNGHVLIDKHNHVSVCDYEETLILAEENR
ncbi:hypothetical protein Tco_1289856 [Tanacetum coccineum]